MLGLAGVHCVTAFSKRASVAVILYPPHRRPLPLIDTSRTFPASHLSSSFVALAHRAFAALRAISRRSLLPRLLSRALAPFFPMADSSLAESRSALALPPLLPKATAFGFFS